MRVVIDTNVFVSGVFWKGPPAAILEAWHDGRIEMILSPAILDEYQRNRDRTEPIVPLGRSEPDSQHVGIELMHGAEFRVARAFVFRSCG